MALDCGYLRKHKYSENKVVYCEPARTDALIGAEAEQLKLVDGNFGLLVEDHELKWHAEEV